LTPEIECQLLVDYQASYYKGITSLKITKGVTKTDLQASVSLVKHYIGVQI